MRRGLAIAAAAALLAAAVPAEAAAPLSTQARELGKRLTALEKRVAKVSVQRARRGPAGPAGAAGAKGPVGDTGPPGDAVTGVPFLSATVPSGSLSTTPSVAVSIFVSPAGRPFFFRGNLVVTNTAAATATVTCNLRTQGIGNSWDTARAKLGPAGGQDTRTLTVMDAFTFGGFSFFTQQIECAATGVAPGSVTFADADLIAVPVDRVLGNLGHL